MSASPSIHVLRGGHHLVPLLENGEVLRWSLCATGQAFSPDPLPPPAIINDLNLVEPLGGNLLHLMLRPSLKQIDLESGHAGTLSPVQRSMLEMLLLRLSPGDAKWHNLLRSRDIFGFCAIDYFPNIDVLRGRTLEHSVSDPPTKPKKFRGIILSLTKNEMLKCDLFHDLIKARETAGIDLFPGINTRNSGKLRTILLRYFDLLDRSFKKTA